MDDDTDDSFRPPNGLGYKPDRPDRRDRALYRAVPNVDALPATSYHLGIPKTFPDPMDQKSIGACVGYSAAQCARSIMVRNRHARPFTPSPVALYLWAREEGGYPEQDCGAEIRNAWRAMNKRGLPAMSNLTPRFRPEDLPDPETWLFPKKSIWVRPVSPSNAADAERRQIVSYYKLETLADVLQSLSEGFPVNFGFTVFRSFYDPYGGARKIIPMPRPGERDLGGHAVNAIDYDKPNRVIWCRNQWGPTAHEGGPDFALSFDFFAAYAGDAWTGRSIEGARPA